NHWAIVADTKAITKPKSFDYSSHELLWDLIEAELKNDFAAMGMDIGRFLASRRERLKIGVEGFDAARFIDGLITPAWQQSVARTLQKAGIRLRLHGKGWGGEFAPIAQGPVESSGGLEAAVGECAGLVHAWPIGGRHPIECVPRPILRPLGLSKQA